MATRQKHWVGCGCNNCRYERDIQELKKLEPLQRELEQRIKELQIIPTPPTV